MRLFFRLSMLVPALSCFAAAAPIPVLTPSDVVFMYQAPRPIYEQYGATVLAWGGKPSSNTLAAAEGVKFFGSVGMVTEFGRYYDRFPTNYESGLCRDLNGQPFKVPWLTDHNHKGTPFWWCCTRQPVFRQYISERVAETVRSGAFGVHIDDHLGTAGTLFLGGCFCDRCIGEFPEFVKAARLKVSIDATNYRDALRTWLTEHPGKKYHDEPNWNTWRTYQLRGAADFMMELRKLAAKTAGRPVPMSANACLLWGPHLSDYKALDFFSAEIDHHASVKRLSDAPVVAYRIADAVGRPLASTASGGDWAFIKANNLPGLVRSWIALGYAAGHSLMAPHRQWCYTPEKGTHWYEGPAEKFASLYKFVRENRDLFEGFENCADLVVAYSQRTYDSDPGLVMRTCEALSRSNFSYRLALGGDAVVDHPLDENTLTAARTLLVLKRQDFTSRDQATLAALAKVKMFSDLAEAQKAVNPAVRTATANLRLFPRIKPDRAVIHILNWDYDPAQDSTRLSQNVRVDFDLAALGVSGAKHARVYVPGQEPKTRELDGSGLIVPEAGLWTVLELRR